MLFVDLDIFLVYDDLGWKLNGISLGKYGYKVHRLIVEPPKLVDSLSMHTTIQH